VKYNKKTKIQTKKKKPYKYHTIDSVGEMKNILYKKEVQDLLNKLAKEEYEKAEKDENTPPPKDVPRGLSTLLVLFLNIFECIIWITSKIKIDSIILYSYIGLRFNLKLRRYHNAKYDVDSSNWGHKVQKEMNKITSMIIEKNNKLGQYHKHNDNNENDC